MTNFHPICKSCPNFKICPVACHAEQYLLECCWYFQENFYKYQAAAKKIETFLTHKQLENFLSKRIN